MQLSKAKLPIPWFVEKKRVKAMHNLAGAEKVEWVHKEDQWAEAEPLDWSGKPIHILRDRGPPGVVTIHVVVVLERNMSK